jgi:hypothetical protein
MVLDNLLSDRLNSFKSGKLLQVIDQTTNNMKSNKEEPIIHDKGLNKIKQETPEIKAVIKSNNS